jgi:tetratricopeptide (TPR) repeat protein
MTSLRVLFTVLSILVATATLQAESAPPNLSEAIAAQQRLIAADPGNADLYNDLGNLLYLGNRSQEAEEAYEASIQLDPELVSVHYNFALLLQQTNRPRRAEREYQKVLKSDVQHAWAHYQTGVLLAKRGRRSAAIQSYARAMRLDARLTDPAFNPHILENSLASSAVLRAYSDLSSAALAPRVYENPGNVTSILLAAQEGMPRPERKLKRQSQRKQRRQAKKSGSDS